jgi:hypothetical protein
MTTFLCTSCVSNSDLRDEIFERGVNIQICGTCRTPNVRALNCKDQRLKGLFRALLRYHFSEWEHNSHWGGDGLESLLLSKNPVTAYCAAWASRDGWGVEEYQTAIETLTSPGYEDEFTAISLFAGYREAGEQNMLLRALKDSFDPSLERLRTELEHVNYFEIERKAQALFEPHRAALARVVDVGTSFARARLGYAARGTPQCGWGDEWHYRPHDGAALSAPPPLKASAGRLNRIGVSMLYVATDEDTAVAEIRPHPSHHVSVGLFSNSRQLEVADFTALSLRKYCQSDAALDEFLLLKTVERLFSLPITPEERDKYSFTQFLADVIRYLGFDGVAYQSSVGTGRNFAFYSPAIFSYVERSARVLRVNALTYSHSLLPAMDPSAEYMTDTSGNLIQ